MRAESLHQWLIDAMRDDLTDATTWLKVVFIVQVEFRDGAMAEKCMWQKIVLILKGKGDAQGIGLVKVLCKAVTSLFNRRLTAEISFHDTLHGFRAGQWMRTAALEAKFFQQLIAMR